MNAPSTVAVTPSGSRSPDRPAPPGGHRILVVEDDPATRALLEDVLVEAGHSVEAVVDGKAALEALDRSSFECVLLDLNLPGLSGMSVLSALPALHTDARFIVMTGFSSVGSAVEAMKLGAHDYVEKPLRPDEVLRLVQRAGEEVGVRRELANVRRLASEAGFAGMVGRAPVMQRLYRTIEQVARTRATVLIEGETGTGKELVAHAIHHVSPRSRKLFVPVNCSALPDTLLDSELFGHTKGSFTGAIQSRKGWIEESAGGTLLLDEVSTLSEDIQVKLLRVLEERVIHRIGSRVPVPVDFRLVVATNRDLAELVRKGDFREDLYYRLAVFPVRVPPLRERRDDIPLLANHFRMRFAEEQEVEPPVISRQTLSRMMAYDWPGNVRELENFIERSVVLNPGGDDIPFDLGPASAGDGGPAMVRAALDREDGDRPWDLDRLEREYILSVLDRVRWQQSVAADLLGISRRTIHRKLKRYREEGLLPDPPV